MTTSIRRLLTPFASPWLLALLMALAVPPLLFSAFLPSWAPTAAVAWLGLVVVLRMAATRRVLGHTPADLALLLLLLTLPVGLWATADRSVTLPRTYAFVANIALFWAIALQRDTRWLRWSGWVLLLAALGLSVFLLPGTQFSGAKLPFINRDLYSLLPGGFRPFWNPAGFNANLTGGILALFLPPAVLLTVAAAGWPQRLLAAFTSLVLVAMLLLAQSRGALIGVALAVPLALALSSRSWAWFWWAILLAGIGAFFLARPDLSANQVLGTSQALGSNSLSGRVELWSRAIYMSQDFAFTGVGLGMFQPVMQLLYPAFLIGPDADVRHPHNIFLQASGEMGFPGLIAFLALFLILAFFLIRQGRSNGTGRDIPDGPYRPLALGLFGSLLVFLVHGLFEVITYAPRAAIVVWALFGLMLAVGTATGLASDAKDADAAPSMLPTLPPAEDAQLAVG